MNGKSQILNRKTMLFHDEELDEKELYEFFEKLDPKTIELIRQEYNND
jgi:hypothetical protein